MKTNIMSISLILLLTVASITFAGSAYSCDKMTTCHFNVKTNGWENCSSLALPTFFEINNQNKTVTITSVDGTDVYVVTAAQQMNSTVIMMEVKHARKGSYTLAFDFNNSEIRFGKSSPEGVTAIIRLYHVKASSVTAE